MDGLRRSHAYQWQCLWALTVCLNERQYWTSLALSHAPSLSLCSGQTQFPAPVSRKWDAVCFFISVLCYVLMASVLVSLHFYLLHAEKQKRELHWMTHLNWFKYRKSTLSSHSSDFSSQNFEFVSINCDFISCISGFSFQNCKFLSLHFEVIHC